MSNAKTLEQKLGEIRKELGSWNVMLWQNAQGDWHAALMKPPKDYEASRRTAERVLSHGSYVGKGDGLAGCFIGQSSDPVDALDIAHRLAHQAIDNGSHLSGHAIWVRK